MTEPEPPSGVTSPPVRDVFEALEQPSTPLTAAEVADRLDQPEPAVRERLETLAAAGELGAKRVGETRVWWHSAAADTTPRAADRDQFTDFVRAVRDYAIFMLDPDGTVVSWNEGAKRIKGYEEAEIVGQHFSTFYTESDTDAGVPERNIETAIEEGRIEDSGQRVRKDGSTFWARVTITAIHDDDGELQGFTKVTRDMTEQRAYQEELRQERDLTEQILETVPVSIFVTDSEGRFVRANRRALGNSGIEESELSEYKADEWELYDEAGDPIPVDERPWSDATETGETVYDFQCQAEIPGFERRWLSISVAPLAADAHPDGRLVFAVDDITDTKSYEQQLEQRKSELETELSEMLGRVSDAFFALDDEWRFTHLNDHAAEILGHEQEALLGRNIWDVYSDRKSVYDEELRTAMAEQTARTFEVYEAEFDGWLEFTAYPSESGLSVYFQDITDRKRREEARQRREQALTRYKQYTDDILDAMDDIFYLLDENADLLRWNDTVREVTGYSEAEIAELNGLDFFPEDQREEIAESVAEAFEAGTTHIEGSLLTSDGSTIPYEFVASTLEDPDGNTVIAGVGRDVSSRREYERKLEASNERLEQFAYAASHDLQEPLRMVSSYLQLVEQRYADELDADGKEFIEYAVDGADRMQEMIEGLLAYSRVESKGEPLEATDIGAVLDEVEQDLQLPIQESGADISADSLPQVRADPTQLRQLFQNLIENAIEYRGEEPPTIEIATQREGDMWAVSVTDDGIGIDPDDAERVFELFQRLHTRQEHAGSGIGLAICRRIVERHGGDIWVESEPGEGTTVSFTLPAAARQEQD